MHTYYIHVCVHCKTVWLNTNYSVKVTYQKLIGVRPRLLGEALNGDQTIVPKLPSVDHIGGFLSTLRDDQFGAEPICGRSELSQAELFEHNHRMLFLWFFFPVSFIHYFKTTIQCFDKKQKTNKQNSHIRKKTQKKKYRNLDLGEEGPGQGKPSGWFWTESSPWLRTYIDSCIYTTVLVLSQHLEREREVEREGKCGKDENGDGVEVKWRLKSATLWKENQGRKKGSEREREKWRKWWRITIGRRCIQWF